MSSRNSFKNKDYLRKWHQLPDAAVESEKGMQTKGFSSRNEKEKSLEGFLETSGEHCRIVHAVGDFLY